MKISANTLAILKNFSKINSNFIVKPGNVLKTISGSQSIYAEATVAENFPVEFSIFDLNRFLASISLFKGKDPDLNFDTKMVDISSGGSSIRYCYSDPVLTKDFAKNLPKTINAPQPDYEFILSDKDFASLSDAASVMSLPDLILEATTDGVFLRLVDKKDKNSNMYTIRVGDNTKNFTFKMIFKMENICIMPGSYTVRISKKKVSEFLNKDGSIKYFISMEHDSTW
jgi:hypothetical protein